MQHLDREPLSKCLDLSNFPVGHPLRNVSNKGKLGYVKIETSSTPIKEVIALQAKCYSVLQADDECKKAAKGVNNGVQRYLKHSMYRDIHYAINDEVTMSMVNIRCRNNKLITIRNRKRALSRIDRKRFWINAVKSLAFGHPDICEYQDKSTDGVNMQRIVKRKFKQASEDMTSNLTFKVSKPGRDMFY